MSDKETKYNQLLEEANKDTNIVGLILGGGRGKGCSTEFSDYDVLVIVNDDKEKEYKEKYESFTDTSEVYVKIYSLTGFKNYAVWGSGFEWDRYSFAHVKAQIDKPGEIQKLIDEKGKLPESEIKKVVADNLDSYINSYHRSMKNFRDKNITASVFDAAESVPLLLTAIFALEGRMKPYNKFLEWELQSFPLTKLPWSNDEFIELLKKIISSGDIETQKDVFDEMKKLFYDNGFKDVINGWNCYYMG
jgi:hypothetical protein